jgi:UDP-MurNAc hydroxylase
MEVTALGHAGLRVVGSGTTGLIDPWLTRRGAFLGSWYQLPTNDHLATLPLLAPDWVVVTSDRADRLDLDTLARIPAGTPLFIPTYASKRLLRLVRERTQLHVVEVGTWMRVSLDDSGSWLTLVPAQSPAHPGAAVLVSIDGESLLNCNDARLTVAQARRARLALGGDVDLATVNVANPSWHPLCYEYPNEVKVELERQKRIARLQVVRRLLRVTAPRLTVPFGGPPCFLDPELADLNRWIATPDLIPSPSQAQVWLRELEPDRAFTTLLPGDRCHPRGQLVLTDARWEEFDYDRLARYLRDYAHERALELSRFHIAHPEADDGLGERFAAHFMRLAGLSNFFLERISMTVRFDVVGPGGGRWDVYLFPGRVRIDLDGRAEEVQYRFTVDSRWLAPVIDGTATWDDLLHSLRCSIARDPDLPNDHLLWLLRLSDRDALLSIEAYERSHDIAGMPGRAVAGRGSEHFGEEEGEAFDDEEALPAPRQRGTQVVPPSMR